MQKKSSAGLLTNKKQQACGDRSASGGTSTNVPGKVLQLVNLQVCQVLRLV